MALEPAGKAVVVLPDGKRLEYTIDSEEDFVKLLARYALPAGCEVNHVKESFDEENFELRVDATISCGDVVINYSGLYIFEFDSIEELVEFVNDLVLKGVDEE